MVFVQAHQTHRSDGYHHDMVDLKDLDRVYPDVIVHEGPCGVSIVSMETICREGGDWWYDIRTVVVYVLQTAWSC